MNIPLEIIIVAVIAAVIITVVIAIIIKKRNQEIDDDYQWSSEHREKRRKKKSKRSNVNIHVDSDTGDNADINIVCDTPLEDPLLSAASLTAEINKIKKQQLEDFETELDLEEAEMDAELSEEVFSRESFGTGKYSNIVGLIAAISVGILNLAIWLLIKPSIDQTIVGAVAYLFPTNWIGAIILTIIEAIIIRLEVINIYEVFSGVATKEEMKDKETARMKAVFLTSAIFIIATLGLLNCRLTYEMITEDGFSHYSPVYSNYHYEWDEMLSFEYDNDGLIALGATDTYIELKDWNELLNDRYDDFQPSKFKHLTEAAEEKYGEGNHMDMMDYIFLEKYAYINEQAN